MSPASDSAHHPGLVLARFFEGAQKYSFHELRGRIGTIANFASVLEGGQASSSETVDVARRIRVNALTTARMMELLGSAIELASHPLRRRPTDLCRLAHSVLAEVGRQGTVHSIGLDSIADVDADLVAFVWRAFLALQGAGDPIRGLHLRVNSMPHECEVELQSGSDELVPHGPDAAEMDIQSYVHHGTGPGRLENGMALILAHHLVASHDGRMGLWGQPGGRSSLRLALPALESAGSVL